MLTSSRRGILYPNTNRSDSADVPRDIAALVAALEIDVIYGQGTFASRPTSSPGTPGIQGRIFVATDLNPHVLYYDYGTGWDVVGTVQDGTVTVIKFDARIPNPNVMLGLMMIEGILPYAGFVSGSPQNSLQASAGAGWAMSFAAGRALIQGDDNTAQGMYLYSQSGSGSLTLINTNPANPRLDVLGIQYNDADYTGRTPTGANLVQVQGTPTAGATLANRNGAPALPASTIWLADYLMKPGDASIVGAQIGDQRVISGPGLWGEDNHRYRLGVDANGALGVELVV